jgi:hypothetical protein
VQLLAAAPAYAYVVLLILLPIRFVGIDGMSEVAAATHGRAFCALASPTHHCRSHDPLAQAIHNLRSGSVGFRSGTLLASAKGQSGAHHLN